MDWKAAEDRHIIDVMDVIQRAVICDMKFKGYIHIWDEIDPGIMKDERS